LKLCSIYSRRDILKKIGIGITSIVVPSTIMQNCSSEKKVKHIITLSFDDGFKKSSIKTAEIYEKYNLSACINVVAAAHMRQGDLPDEYHKWPVGDFGLWNELQERGHEIMPHGWEHANLTQIPLEKAQELVLRCLDYFSKNLKGFDPQKAVFNFPYNASSPELEEWLPKQVLAFRTAGPAVNAMPHKGQVRLTCTSYGPDNIDKNLDQEIENLLAQPYGWLIYNTHGLDEEGWGPMTASFLDQLLAKLVKIDSVHVLPAGWALV
jgi:peptidoglycan/xylan/chitin deacetylase (PgdA/CDA1 family)